MGALFSAFKVVSLFFGAMILLHGPVYAEPELVRKITGSAIQGNWMVFATDPENQVIIDGEIQAISPQGLFVIGFHRDDTARLEVRAIRPDGTEQKVFITPEQRQYDIQRIDNLPTNMVSPPADVIARIQADIQAVKAARAQTSFFDDAIRHGFDWPVWGRVSGIYGSQRILNGQPRQPHYGIDIAAAPGLAVTAPASGKIVLAKDLYFTGNTIIIDHGFSLNSTYSHLQQMWVDVGEEVTRGQIIATVGSTGRSTGPHLDWRINWKQKRLDPMLLAGPLAPALPAQRPQ